MIVLITIFVVRIVAPHNETLLNTLVTRPSLSQVANNTFLDSYDLIHSLSYKSECGNSFIYSILILYIKKIRKVITNIKQLNARDTIKFNNSENLSNN